MGLIGGNVERITANEYVYVVLVPMMDVLDPLCARLSSCPDCHLGRVNPPLSTFKFYHSLESVREKNVVGHSMTRTKGSKIQRNHAGAWGPRKMGEEWSAVRGVGGWEGVSRLLQAC